MAHIPRFEELDYQKTPLGDLILRKTNRSLSRKRGNLRNYSWKRLSHVVDVYGR
jgi:hypothetical protein